MSEETLVTCSDPDVMSGTPVFAGTRVLPQVLPSPVTWKGLPGPVVGLVPGLGGGFLLLLALLLLL